MLSERTALLDCIKKREEKQANAFSISGPQERETKKKRQRRLANQIIRLYNCPESKCKKSYGYLLFPCRGSNNTIRSEFSLTQHLKSKHPERVEDLLGQMKQKLKTDPSAWKKLQLFLKLIGYNLWIRFPRWEFFTIYNIIIIITIHTCIWKRIQWILFFFRWSHSQVWSNSVLWSCFITYRMLSFINLLLKHTKILWIGFVIKSFV